MDNAIRRQELIEFGHSFNIWDYTGDTLLGSFKLLGSMPDIKLPSVKDDNLVTSHFYLVSRYSGKKNRFYQLEVDGDHFVTLSEICDNAYDSGNSVRNVLVPDLFHF